MARWNKWKLHNFYPFIAVKFAWSSDRKNSWIVQPPYFLSCIVWNFAVCCVVSSIPRVRSNVCGRITEEQTGTNEFDLQSFHSRISQPKSSCYVCFVSNPSRGHILFNWWWSNFRMSYIQVDIPRRAAIGIFVVGKKCVCNISQFPVFKLGAVSVATLLTRH